MKEHYMQPEVEVLVLSMEQCIAQSPGADSLNERPDTPTWG